MKCGIGPIDSSMILLGQFQSKFFSLLLTGELFTFPQMLINHPLGDHSLPKNLP